MSEEVNPFAMKICMMYTRARQDTHNRAEEANDYTASLFWETLGTNCIFLHKAILLATVADPRQEWVLDETPARKKKEKEKCLFWQGLC